jgi:hypothetical protein
LWNQRVAINLFGSDGSTYLWQKKGMDSTAKEIEIKLTFLKREQLNAADLIQN